MEPDHIEITLNGQPAMTRQQLAVALGKPATAGETTVRHALRRAGVAPAGKLDGRTPLYLTAEAMRALSGADEDQADPGSRSDASASEPTKS